tara:strand:+ start:147 stop:599 length:453 start_codon:yes stop_codon:yes gene_type:complete
MSKKSALIFERIGKLIPGFDGYAKKENARESDYQIRLYVKRKLEEFIYNIERSKVNTPDNELLSVDKAQNDLKLFCSKIVNQKFGYSSLFDNKNSDKTVNENVLKTIIKNDEEFIDLINQIDMTLCDALTIENLSYKLNIILKNRIEIIG